ncbi:MAG: 3-phosphoshikimate 1-carboxyvinyltransferase [Vicinamibacteria bacterium]|jgi:3-phosphoshikimate 1-carboxyvinyltransferase|nr:3-phosphoshikimate 1-carboxyvinyltransferase [Vicinamibacteria bacterium]
MRIHPARAFRGAFRMPGDKSITHRAYLFGALAKGVSTIEGASQGDDCNSTRRCLSALGLVFEDAPGRPLVAIGGAEELKAPVGMLDCGNSGTTLRLLMGVIAASNITCELSGDESLNRRPMERVAAPLRLMGARIETTNGRPPVRVTGTKLQGASVTPEAASAQIKSAVLLAALRAEGKTVLHEPVATRDHTERMIRSFGGRIRKRGTHLEIEGPQVLTATHVRIPGDPSSAAPFVVAALIRPDSEVVIEGVLLNPHRVRYLDVLREMGGRIETEITSTTDAEPSGRIIVRSSELRGIRLPEDAVPAIVDELPILAVAAAFAEGRFEVRGAGELRVKESDRIKAMVEGLATLGARVVELEDGFTVEGRQPLRGATVQSHGDHRIAMALAVAALGAEGDTEIAGAEVVSISLPGFFSELARGAAR